MIPSNDITLSSNPVLGSVELTFMVVEVREMLVAKAKDEKVIRNRAQRVSR